MGRRMGRASWLKDFTCTTQSSIQGSHVDTDTQALMGITGWVGEA